VVTTRDAGLDAGHPELLPAAVARRRTMRGRAHLGAQASLGRRCAVLDDPDVLMGAGGASQRPTMMPAQKELNKRTRAKLGGARPGRR
jgi:hypothetical protein